MEMQCFHKNLAHLLIKLSICSCLFTGIYGQPGLIMPQPLMPFAPIVPVIHPVVQMAPAFAVHQAPTVAAIGQRLAMPAQQMYGLNPMGRGSQMHAMGQFPSGQLASQTMMNPNQRGVIHGQRVNSANPQTSQMMMASNPAYPPGAMGGGSPGGMMRPRTGQSAPLGHSGMGSQESRTYSAQYGIGQTAPGTMGSQANRNVPNSGNNPYKVQHSQPGAVFSQHATSPAGVGKSSQGNMESPNKNMAPYQGGSSSSKKMGSNKGLSSSGNAATKSEANHEAGNSPMSSGKSSQHGKSSMATQSSGAYSSSSFAVAQRQSEQYERELAHLERMQELIEAKRSQAQAQAELHGGSV